MTQKGGSQQSLLLGGDKYEYDGDTRTETANLPTIDIHINSTISTLKAQYLTADIKELP